MTLEQYPYLAEILGVIIIVVTLLYLSVQVRQGARALLATSREATMTAELQFLSKYMDYPEIAMGFGDQSLGHTQAQSGGSVFGAKQQNGPTEADFRSSEL